MTSDNYTEAKPIREFTVDALPVKIFPDRPTLAQYAANFVHVYLRQTIASQGSAAAILATGNSQIEFLQKLVTMPGIDWNKVTLFHMDEYLGIKADHKASFRRYLRERVESLVKPRAFHYIEGDAPLPLDEIERYNNLLEAQPIDLCCMGIGENGHIAFNDPPVANFRDKHLLKLVQLDDACKMQQVREGHFPSLEAVNPYAYTLTIPALFKARKVICIAPETRKAAAVKAALRDDIGTQCPASALRTQSQAVLLLDKESAAQL
ncbi:MAG TPA: glucosamine-6-phosphate deaminase [Verrucomicrobiae bacterium]|jgi:glucosamine-6-phosphate deaminase